MFSIDIQEYENVVIYPINEITQIPYYELIKVEVVVKIFIENILFFEDDYFPILEFIYQFRCWERALFDTDFLFNSIESDDNPIISIKLNDGDCTFDSKWKLSNGSFTVKLSEVLSEINKCERILFKNHKNQGTVSVENQGKNQGTVSVKTPREES